MTDFHPAAVGPYPYNQCFNVVEKAGRYNFALDDVKTHNLLDVVDQRGPFGSASEAAEAAFSALEKIEWDLMVSNAQDAGFMDFLLGDDLAWARLSDETLQIILMTDGKYSVNAMPLDSATILEDGEKGPAWNSESKEFDVELQIDENKFIRVAGSKADFETFDSFEYPQLEASEEPIFGGKLASFREAMECAMQVSLEPSAPAP